MEEVNLNDMHDAQKMQANIAQQKAAEARRAQEEQVETATPPTAPDAVASASVEIQIGDVVQIEPTQPALGGCFGRVTEIRPWGVIVDVPISRDSYAPVRLQTGEYERIGSAKWVPVTAGEPT
jgi:hypothetical protein